MSRQSRIETALTVCFEPERLVVINESHLHAGHHHSDSDHHGSFDGTGETHFRIRIVAPAFAGMSRIERHRAVNELLKDELDGGLHAMAVEASAPGETTRW
ncbi:MAG: BolA family transcriptional regulator [Hoeflea sp.]|uniref:BolA family protein n=1 Tax=Hoeflea sp. TaxID=1940281 RepID=UPI001D346C24|nr:BolA family protein [Hoeflea sp.]MBU4528626.1 BolA family transcriptional regulator [Alphaproteobacteria bacterium]MBU4545569.1 BolA family transcriptional regulator [Alphaproteobacteria bacterium]MBU4552179.1 BolA family transcriptional regulator [Alphaproteobacteria bacterium]MBV1726229.1 BolA family transcriptional regulator [Hoeflea sp.]MBV1762344.1 BolA family transcriptional regulator [Hoeflea sp.]